MCVLGSTRSQERPRKRTPQSSDHFIPSLGRFETKATVTRRKPTVFLQRRMGVSVYIKSDGNCWGHTEINCVIYGEKLNFGSFIYLHRPLPITPSHFFQTRHGGWEGCLSTICLTCFSQAISDLHYDMLFLPVDALVSICLHPGSYGTTIVMP